jgi:hypothetical protein
MGEGKGKGAREGKENVKSEGPSKGLYRKIEMVLEIVWREVYTKTGLY